MAQAKTAIEKERKKEKWTNVIRIRHMFDVRSGFNDIIIIYELRMNEWINV